jgi:hypothetical protein
MDISPYDGVWAVSFAERRATNPSSATTRASAIHKSAGCFSVILRKRSIIRPRLIGRIRLLRPHYSPRSRLAARKMPRSQRQSQHAQPIRQQRLVAVMNLPAAPEGRTRGQQHEYSTNAIHAFSPRIVFILPLSGPIHPNPAAVHN